MIRDSILCFSGTPSSATPDPTVNLPSTATSTVMPQTIDTSPLGLPTGSGGGSTSLPNAGRDLGIGGEMWINVLLAVAATASSGTLYIALVTGTSSTAPATVLLQSPTTNNTAIAALPVSGNGSIVWRTQLPAGGNFSGGVAYAQYIGLEMVTTIAGFSTGALFAELLVNIQAADILGSGFAIE